MEEQVVIRVNKVSKTFRLPHEKNSSIKNTIINFYRSKKTYELQKALGDISFNVNKGEFFGIVGRNGSGKSTLLKLLAGIYSPTKGDVDVYGKLTPFIELGVGFNSELTGRENVFLNGALFGFNHKEMEAMYDDIVSFAELEKFMDQKLKNYSSGMQVRLAFSIAIQVQTDILVLDEVLAVGDEAFQQKCIDIFEKYKAEKKTIILVTHDMGMVRRFCSRAMLINDGELISIGKPWDIAQKYSELNDERIDEDLNTNSSDENIDKSKIKLKIQHASNKENPRFVEGDKLRVDITWPSSTKGVENVGVAIMKQSGEYVFGANTFNDDVKMNGKNTITYEADLALGSGKYYLMAGLFGAYDTDQIDFLTNGPKFIVQNKLNDTSQGIAYLRHEWKDK